MLNKGEVCYLSLREVERLGELLPFLPDDVLVLLEGLLQLQQLVGGEGRADPLRLPEGQQELWEVGTCTERDCL